MSIAYKDIGQLVNCDNLHIALVTADTDSAYTAGTVEYLAKLGEVKEDAKTANAPSAFDGAIAYNHFYEGAGETTLTIPGLTERKAAELTGKPYDSTKGIVFDTGDPSRAPIYALGYRVQSETDDGPYNKYRWFLKGRFVLSATTAKSAGEKKDPQSQEVTFYPLKTVHKWDLPDPQNAGQTISDGLKRTVTDTSDPAFTTESAWFSQVQTPDTIGAPSALALSSSNPAANATGVLATVHPTLTFNNAISDYSGISLVKSDGTLVTAPITANTTGKVLTLTPSASLTASAVYFIVLAGVLDAFGQTITNQTIKFTVAS